MKKSSSHLHILSPSRHALRMLPTTCRFITGLASSYDDEFPEEILHSLMKVDDFEIAMNQINHTLTDYWPCWFCTACGYICCPCTAGFSFCCPAFCINDVRTKIIARSCCRIFKMKILF